MKNLKGAKIVSVDNNSEKIVLQYEDYNSGFMNISSCLHSTEDKTKHSYFINYVLYIKIQNSEYNIAKENDKKVIEKVEYIRRYIVKDFVFESMIDSQVNNTNKITLSFSTVEYDEDSAVDKIEKLDNYDRTIKYEILGDIK